MKTSLRKLLGGLAVAAAASAVSLPAHAEDPTVAPGDLNPQLVQLLQQAGFTGRIESTLETRLGRPLKPKLAQAGEGHLLR